jgi:ABC-type transport system substrate-binding protein
MHDIKSQVSDATCTITTDNGARNLIINPAKPPFDNPELRRALSLTLDRKAFIDILVEGQGLIGGAMRRWRQPARSRTAIGAGRLARGDKSASPPEPPVVLGEGPQSWFREHQRQGRGDCDETYFPRCVSAAALPRASR